MYLTSWVNKLTDITPIQKVGDIYVKRDDLYEKYGSWGAKTRACDTLIQDAISKGFTHITTAGSKSSPQINIVAHLCKQYGLEFTAHCPQGVLGDEVESAKSLGANIIQHRGGYNNVIISKSRNFAKDNNAYDIPFGMESEEAVIQTASQVINIPKDVKRIVIPIGGAMNFCGLLRGLDNNDLDIPVLGVIIGKDPYKTINKYAPFLWQSRCTIVESGYKYHDEIEEYIGDIRLDPVYEAKCKQFLEPNDLMWIVGIRSKLRNNV